MNQSLDHSEHLRRPDFLSNDAVSLVSEFFGIDGTAKELPGERDRNFLIQQSKGQRFVLKIFNQCESKELLEIQNEALTKTLNVLGSGRSPNLLANQNNDFLTKIESKTGIQHWLRLVGYVEGIPFPNGDYLIVNEEGKLKGLPLNPEATALWKATFDNDNFITGRNDFVVGPAILIKKSALKIWAS